MELKEADQGALLGERQHQAETYQDKFFSNVFFINVSVILGIALLFGIPNVSRLYFTVHDNNSSSHGVKFLAVFISTSCIGALVSVAWLHVLRQHAQRIISWTLRFSILIFILNACFAFADSGYGGRAVGFINLFLALLLALFYCGAHKNIPFAASNLAMASRILCLFPSLIYSAYFAIAAQAVWILIWGLACIGVIAETSESFHDLGAFGNTCFFFMLLSLFWVLQVVKNVVHCIAAGTVGEWWYGSYSAETVNRSRTRALSTSFGSICLGSLLIAILNTLNLLLLSTTRRKSQGSVNACLECVVELVTRYVQYFNRFAFCQVALYGKDFQSAGYDTMHLFRDRGWTSLINDSLISGVLSVGCLVVGAVSGVIGSVWLNLAMQCTKDEMERYPQKCETFNIILLTFIACAAVGYAMCAIVSSVLDSVVTTIFVCFAEDPAALQKSSPQEYSRLVESWKRLKPEFLHVDLSSSMNKSHDAILIFVIIIIQMWYIFNYKSVESILWIAGKNKTKQRDY